MRPTMLQLPPRTSKPRTKGLTMMVDGGLPTRQFQDIVESGAEFLDFVKFGWGTAIVTNDLQRKIDVLDDVGVDYYFGGTLFEKFVLQDRFDDFRDLCERFGCRYVEVSNGTIDLSHIEKAGYVTEAGRRVQRRVRGRLQGLRSARSAWRPNRWIECIHEDLDAGAFLVTLESRESGQLGHLPAQRRAPLRPHRGDPRQRRRARPPALRGAVDGAAVLLRRGGSAPTSISGNIASTAILGLETIRLGLRADTLECFEGAVS